MHDGFWENGFFGRRVDDGRRTDDGRPRDDSSSVVQQHKAELKNDTNIEKHANNKHLVTEFLQIT